MEKQIPLEVLLQKLSQYLKQTPANLRNSTAAVLSSLVHHLEDYELSTRMLSVLLAPKTKPEAKVKHLRIVQGGDAP